jgi:hypothetical protein
MGRFGIGLELIHFLEKERGGILRVGSEVLNRYDDQCSDDGREKSSRNN